jgi:hypothetical protein
MNNNKLLRKVLLIGLFFALIMFVSQSVLAIGITPGKTNFDYRPGEINKVEFNVINTENKDIDVVVLVQGELNKSISASESVFVEYMSKNGVKKAIYTSVGSGSIKDGEGNPVGLVNFKIGKFVLSINFPEFESKPVDESNHLDITKQFEGFRLKDPPERVDNGEKIRINMVGPENKVIQITARSWSYYSGLQI